MCPPPIYYYFPSDSFSPIKISATHRIGFLQNGFHIFFSRRLGDKTLLPIEKSITLFVTLFILFLLIMREVNNLSATET